MNQTFTRCIRTATLSLAVFVCLGVGNPNSIPVERFLERARFEQARALPARKIDLKSCASVKGAVVNHHALASDLLWKLFRRLASCRPEIKRVIILAPDHFFQGQTTITTAKVRYQWGKKQILVEEETVNQLLRTKITTSQPALFQKEHAVGALIPFLMETLPDAKIVPIVVRPDVSRRDAERLSEELKKLLNKDTVLIVSSDMSHYLPEKIALRKDQETLRAFDQSTAAFFWSAKDDHLDFGKGIWIALRTLGPSTFEVLDRDISSRYGGSAAYTTSYITGMWSN